MSHDAGYRLCGNARIRHATACGLGFSERVFWIFEGVSAREGVPFPQLRHEIDETTKTIYPNLF